MSAQDERAAEAQVEELLRAASPGPWRYGTGPLFCYDDGVIDAKGNAVLTNSGRGMTSPDEDGPDAKLLPVGPASLATALDLARALREHDCMGTIALDSDAIEGCDKCLALAAWTKLTKELSDA